jgi:hypothetical protein
MEQPVPANDRHYKLALWSLICGIAGVVICCLGIPLGIVAIVLGVKAMNAEKQAGDVARSGRTMATIGIVLGGLAILCGIFGIISWASCFSWYTGAMRHPNLPVR